MAWVYILSLQNGQYYVGSTSNVEKRLEQHTQKQTATTRRLRVQGVLLKQEYATLKDARSVEQKIKKLKRRDYVEKMIKERYIKILP